VHYHRSVSTGTILVLGKKAEFLRVPVEHQVNRTARQPSKWISLLHELSLVPPLRHRLLAPGKHGRRRSSASSTPGRETGSPHRRQVGLRTRVLGPVSPAVARSCPCTSCTAATTCTASCTTTSCKLLFRKAQQR
jgi:hypothetical protein